MAGTEWRKIGRVDEVEQDPRGELVTMMQKHEVPLYRYLVALTGDREVALDCVQDAFTRAYEYLQQGKGVNTQWLYKVARNRGIDELRRRKREAMDHEALEGMHTERSSEDMVSLQSAFCALSPDDRAILSLVGIEGLSGEEVATRLGIRSGSVRMRVLRARERFRKLYSGGRS